MFCLSPGSLLLVGQPVGPPVKVVVTGVAAGLSQTGPRPHKVPVTLVAGTVSCNQSESVTVPHLLAIVSPSTSQEITVTRGNSTLTLFSLESIFRTVSLRPVKTNSQD